MEKMKMAKHKKKGHGEFPFKLTEWIPVFASGNKYPQMVSNSNPEGFVSQALIEDLASSYSKDVHEAPITKNHQDDGEASGWVGELRVQGNKLMMKIKSVVNEFSDDLFEGRYKYPSVELYEPSHHANPSAGRWYLRAVTYLGAAPPAVKGLYAGFSEAWKVQREGDSVICFCVNESKLETFGENDMTPEEVQKKIDESLAKFSETLTESLTKSLGETMAAKFTELEASLKPEPKDTRKPDEVLKAEFAEEKRKHTETQTRLAALEDSEKEKKAVATKQTAVTFKETLLNESRMTPAEYIEKCEKRVAVFVEANDLESLNSFRETVMSTTEKNTVFAEVAPIVEAAKKAGLTIAQESQIRSFGEDYGDENATDESLALTRDGISRFNEAVKKGESSDANTLLESMISAQIEQIAKGVKV